MRRLIAPLAALLVALTLALPTGGISMAHAATSVLAPTQITVTTGTVLWPSSNGFALPVGETYFRGTVDTSQMPSTDSFWLYVQFKQNNVWPAISDLGDGILVTGGTHPQRDGTTAITEAFESAIPLNPYPSRARFITVNAGEAVPVTVQGDME